MFNVKITEQGTVRVIPFKTEQLAMSFIRTYIEQYGKTDYQIKLLEV